jgi:hypothetical protein
MASEQRQGNLLHLQRRQIKTVPAYHPEQHRPAAHPQRAQVVGPKMVKKSMSMHGGASKSAFYSQEMKTIRMMVVRVAMTTIQTLLGWMY